MSAYITYTRCILFSKLKSIAKTTAGAQGCLVEHAPSYAEGGGVVKEQVDGWG